MIGDGNLDKTITFAIEDAKAKNGIFEASSSIRLILQRLRMHWRSIKKANDNTIDAYSDGMVKAHVTSDKCVWSFATFTIPYHSGWSVTVDGKKQK